MREILFRAKCIDNGEWGYGVPIKDALAGSHDGYYPKIIPECDGRHQTIYSTAIKEETLGQYTGLKDLHGTRIFEGDVVKSIAAWYVVEFENGGYGLRPFGKGKLIPIMGHGNFNENEVEVIGNVYDDVNLLEGEK